MSTPKLTLAQTICEQTRQYLLNHKGVVFGQCLIGAGQVAGTVPNLDEEHGIYELSMADVAGSGFAVGYALDENVNETSRDGRAIYIVRYNGFFWFNAAFLANYAAKIKEIGQRSCPILIRGIGTDGSAGPSIGPVAACSQHGMFIRTPGMPIIAPMTPGEWLEGWNWWHEHDSPLFISEYRTSYGLVDEMPHIIHENADITIVAISGTRLNAIKAVEELEKININCNLIHQVWLKPFSTKVNIYRALNTSTHGGIILDTDFENGTSKCLAADLMLNVDKKIRVLGLEERTAGFAKHLDNLPPSPEKIIRTIRHIVGK